jgi:ABC-type transport system involved in multi-copper enzyme maturation permease subunit
MSTRFANFSLPLLARELTELAARRRTYIIRVAFSACLLSCAWLMFQLALGVTDASLQPLGFLGTGARLLRSLGLVLNIGLLLILPPLACDVFTREKERQTIGLLFLTRLGPWTIVLEKYLSRLVPALCLMLISSPLLGFSYALGGIEIADLMGTAIGLFTNAATLTAVAVACSSMCRTSTSAFLLTCLLTTVTPLVVVPNNGALNAFDVIAFGGFIHRTFNFDPVSITSSIRSGGSVGGGFNIFWVVLLGITTSSLPSFFATVFYLCLARMLLISRAFKSESRLFRWPGRHGIRAVGGNHPSMNSIGVSNYCDDRFLPDQLPVAWRENSRHWPSSARVRIALLLIMLLAWYVFLIPELKVTGSEQNIVLSLVMGQLLLWVGTTIWLIARAAGSISRERGHQTLNVLLTTPIPGREILLQKMKGIRASVWTWLLPLATLLFLRLAFLPLKAHVNGRGLEYPLGAFNELTMLMIYPQLIVWIAFYFSLKSSTAVMAIVKSILSILILCLAPWLILACIAIACGGLTDDYFGPVVALLMFGPENLLLYGYGFESIPPGFHESFFPVCLNSAIHGGLWLAIRRYCLRNADRLLGRI